MSNHFILEISEEIIGDIVDDLDMGMVCYLHKETGSYKGILHEDNWFDTDIEPWKDDIEEINKNKADYIEIEKMSSRESFQVMVNFAESMKDVKFQDRLFSILDRSKPFRNFKWEIDNSDYREEWFVFKKKKNIKYVKQQIKELTEI